MSEQTTTGVPNTQPIESSYSRLLGFWEKNSKNILIAGAVVIIGIGAFFAYKHFIQQPKEEKAAEAMFKAEDYFRKDSLSKALNGDGLSLGFLKIMDRYSGTDAANLAHYYAGSVFLQQGDFANAVKHLKEFSTSSPVLKSRSLALLGDALSEQGKQADAVDSYQKAAAAFEKDEAFSSEYLFRAGYLLESMGKKKEAIAQYKLIKEKYPSTQRGYDIDKYLARLGEIN